MPIEIKGRESIRIEDGKHTGKIAKVEAREVKDFSCCMHDMSTGDFVYLDTFVSLADVICFGSSDSMESPFMRFVGSNGLSPSFPEQTLRDDQGRACYDKVWMPVGLKSKNIV